MSWYILKKYLATNHFLDVNFLAVTNLRLTLFNFKLTFHLIHTDHSLTYKFLLMSVIIMLWQIISLCFRQWWRLVIVTKDHLGKFVELARCSQRRVKYKISAYVTSCPFSWLQQSTIIIQCTNDYHHNYEAIVLTSPTVKVNCL